MSDQPDRDLLAAEYVLGSLEGEERADAARLLATDPTFARSVVAWQRRLTPLAEIALVCGFSDQSHLSFLFKRYMGLSPSKYRSLAGVNLEADHKTMDRATPSESATHQVSASGA